MTDRRDEALERLGRWRGYIERFDTVPLTPGVALRLIEGLQAVLERHRGCPRCSDCLCPEVFDVTRAILGPGAEGTQDGPKK